MGLPLPGLESTLFGTKNYSVWLVLRPNCSDEGRRTKDESQNCRRSSFVFRLSSHLDAFASANGNQIWIFGSEGTIHVDNEQRIFTGRRGDQALAELANPREQQAFHRVEEEFVNAIRGRERVTMNTFETGVRYMEWTEAIYRSAVSGAAITL